MDGLPDNKNKNDTENDQNGTKVGPDGKQQIDFSGEFHEPVNFDNRKVAAKNYIEGGQNNTIDNRRYVIKANTWIVISVIILISSISGGLLYYFTRPIIPTEMSKDFNIAVTEIKVLDPQGNSIDSNDGRKLSQFIFDELNQNFKQMAPEIIPEIWNYDLAGMVAGGTPDERQVNAQVLAEKIHADVVIYGVIIKDGDRTSFSPEFYVNYQGFKNNAPEILGSTQLGRPLEITLPFDRSNDASGGNSPLIARTQALGLLTIGLAYYSNDDYVAALKYFDQAVNIEKWLDGAGKEVAYILRGNTQTRLAYKNSDYSGLGLALDDYQKAWKITNHTNARALIGIGGIYYLDAITSENIDLEKLSTAESFFMDALKLPNQPKSYNIDAKAHFGLGQVYQSRSALSNETSLMDQAEQEYLLVISKYENGNQSVRELASQSYARMGLLSIQKGDLVSAADWYQKAVKIAGPQFKAEYSGSVGIVYYQLGLNEIEKKNSQVASQYLIKAQEFLKTAIQYGESNADQKMIDRYQPLLDQLQGQYKDYLKGSN